MDNQKFMFWSFSASLLLIACWLLGANGSITWPLSSFITAVVLTVMALVVGLHALLAGPSTAFKVSEKNGDNITGQVSSSSDASASPSEEARESCLTLTSSRKLQVTLLSNEWGSTKAEADETKIQEQEYYEQGSYDDDSSGQTSETTEEDLSHEIHEPQLEDQEEPDKVAIFE